MSFMVKEFTVKDLDINTLGDRQTTIDRALTFLLGIDNRVDLQILRYIYNNSLKTVSYAQLKEYMVCEHEFCTEQRLKKRLSSLLDFKYVGRFEAYNNTFYQMMPDKINKELL